MKTLLSIALTLILSATVMFAQQNEVKKELVPCTAATCTECPACGPECAKVNCQGCNVHCGDSVPTPCVQTPCEKATNCTATPCGQPVNCEKVTNCAKDVNCANANVCCQPAQVCTKKPAQK